MDFIRKFFNLYNKNKFNQVNNQEKNKKIIEMLLSIIFSDEYLSTPIYLHGFVDEDQSRNFGTLYPLKYVWNENLTEGGQLKFNFSVNGAVVGSMLEKMISRQSSEFEKIRDTIISLLCENGKKALIGTIEQLQLPPSKILKNFEYEKMIDLN